MKGLRCFLFTNMQQKKEILTIILIAIKVTLLVQHFPLRYYHRRYFSNNHSLLTDLHPYIKNIRLVKRVIKNLPWQITCLMESMIAKDYLLKHGLFLPISIGVRNSKDFEAHAWYSKSTEKDFIKINTTK